MKNRLLITMGDPSGIGPEIIIKLFNSHNFDNIDLKVVGIKEAFLKHTNKLNFDIIEPDYNEEREFPLGVINGYSGKAAMLSIELAVKLILNGKADALVTAPINKKAINLAGYNFPGHTEFLGSLTNSTNYSMMLMGDKIRTILVTTHLPLRDVPLKINRSNIEKAILNAHKAGPLFGTNNPHIAVASLNPHAGDNGLLGTEEEEIIIPAIESMQYNGINVSGPYPADTLFAKMLNNFCDFAVVMYHDQGLIPVKMESFGNAVNVTLNLPIIRTSVDHGTAFDIVGKNIASEGSLKRAIEIANMMVNNVKSN
ncbi:MAG: 4-hydroxythreonine-4-phosphate dehydrogenase PdxA [Deferribacterales bacterium]